MSDAAIFLAGYFVGAFFVMVASIVLNRKAPNE